MKLNIAPEPLRVSCPCPPLIEIVLIWITQTSAATESVQHVGFFTGHFGRLYY